MFLIAIVLSPIFLAIPSFATAPALMYVGMLMLTSVLKIDFNEDKADAAAAYMAIIMMPLTYSIANGIMFGVITWVVVKLVGKKVKDISPVMWVIFILFMLRILSLAFDFN